MAWVGPQERAPADNESLSEEALFHILSNSRRRDVLRYVGSVDEPVDIGDLAEHIAAWENDTEPEQVSRRQRRSVYTSLYQNHLPRLADAGVIEAGRGWQGISLTERARAFEEVLLTDTDRTRTVAGSFFALALLEFVVLWSVWLDLFPGSPSSVLGPAVVLVSVLMLSSLVVTLQ